MRFCQDCGTKLRYKLVKTGEESKSALACNNCGFFIETEGLTAHTSVVNPTSSIEVVSNEEKGLKSMPTVSAICPKCNHNTAFWWLLQTRGGDEATTQFYRCEKCSHTWRAYV